MEQALGGYYTPQGRFRGKFAIVRYADDLAVFCPSQEEARKAKSRLADWLEARGLKLSQEKTHIRHLREGFDFLGFNIRHYPTPNSSRSGYKLLIKPSRESIQQLRRKLKRIWRKQVGSPTVALINELNPIIRGWSNYFRIGVAKEVFTALDSFMYRRAQRYTKRRHPMKSGRWRTEKYWGRTLGHQDRWVFMDKERHATLRKFAWTPIIRHRLVPQTYSPDDPNLQDYWQQRRQRTAVQAYRYRRLFHRQHGVCPICHQHVENGEETHIHHVIPKKRGGTDDLDNLWLVHHNCHRQIHSSNPSFEVRRLLEPDTR